MRASCSHSTCRRSASRRRRTWRVAALVLAAATWLTLAVLLPGCAGYVPEPTAAHVSLAAARWPGTTRETLAEGRRLYVFRCSGCHSLVLPGSQTPDNWPAAVYEMSERAQLDHEQTETVIRYLVTVSETEQRRAAAGRGARGVRE